MTQSKFDETGPANKQKKISKQRFFWTADEVKKYLYFICANFQILQQPQVDETVFKLMVKYINSNNKKQTECYNFHDRMKRKHKTLQSIKESLRQKYNIKKEQIDCEVLNITTKKNQQLKRVQILKNKRNHQSLNKRQNLLHRSLFSEPQILLILNKQSEKRLTNYLKYFHQSESIVKRMQFEFNTGTKQDIFFNLSLSQKTKN